MPIRVRATPRQRGFTLIELMIVVAIVAILGVVAIPAYGSYMMRGRLTEAYTGLATVQSAAEEYWASQRTYAGFDRLPPNSTYFTYALTSSSASAYVVTATGRSSAAGFAFTIDQNGGRASTVPTGWTGSTTCWVDRKDGRCAQ